MRRAVNYWTFISLIFENISRNIVSIVEVLQQCQKWQAQYSMLMIFNKLFWMSKTRQYTVINDNMTITLEIVVHYFFTLIKQTVRVNKLLVYTYNVKCGTYYQWLISE